MLCGEATPRLWSGSSLAGSDPTGPESRVADTHPPSPPWERAHPTPKGWAILPAPGIPSPTGQRVRRSILYAEPSSRLACSFISEATAEASQALLNERCRLVATPRERETIGKA